jgi:RNA polymerase sigma factor (sigma-70 family)
VLTRAEYDFWKKKAYFVAVRTVPSYHTEDMVAWGMVSLVTSLRTYSSDHKLSLSNYVLGHMRWAMLDAARVLRPGSRKDTAKKIFYTEVALDKAREIQTAPETDADHTEHIDLLRAIEKLSPKRKAFMLAYLEHDDVARAAAAIGVSTDCGRSLHWEAVRALRKLLVGP